MLIRKILIIGACDAELVLSRFRPEEISVIGKDEDITWLWNSDIADFVQKMDGVKAAILVYNQEETRKRIFKRFALRGIPVVLIIANKKNVSTNVKIALMKKLIGEGARGVFYEDFSLNPLMVEEFYRQVNKLAA